MHVQSSVAVVPTTFKFGSLGGVGWFREMSCCPSGMFRQRGLTLFWYVSDPVVGLSDPEEQRKCLDLGKQAGLNIPVITKSVVEQIRNIGVVRMCIPSGWVHTSGHWW